jgi:hypothetical protein
VLVTAEVHARERMANGPRRSKMEAKVRTLTWVYLFLLGMMVIATGLAWLMLVHEPPRSTLAQKRLLVPLVALVFATTGAVGLVLGRVHVNQSKERVGGMSLQRATDILLGGYSNIHWARATLLVLPALLAIVATMITGDSKLLLVPAGCIWIMAWMVPTFARYERFAKNCIASK